MKSIFPLLIIQFLLQSGVRTVSMHANPSTMSKSDKELILRELKKIVSEIEKDEWRND